MTSSVAGLMKFLNYSKQTSQWCPKHLKNRKCHQKSLGFQQNPSWSLRQMACMTEEIIEGTSVNLGLSSGPKSVGLNQCHVQPSESLPMWSGISLENILIRVLPLPEWFDTQSPSIPIDIEPHVARAVWVITKPRVPQ
eukprot:maker-scaffold48_size466083-snap-gene-3.31 protein:Tk05988 transcript:maker-scaffold48_size466083-snap-gene-3.31-mRNA-1 annotation:"hypothetical protein COCVIDRAFT_37464"